MPNKKLEAALKLARMGFHVFPLEPNSKLPAIDGYPTKATTDEQQIKNWWQCPVLQTPLNRNIGISTSRYTVLSDTSSPKQAALLVVDIDVKDKKRGDLTLEQMEMLGDEFPPTLTFLTPTGGKHLVYVVDQAVNQRQAEFLGPGLDIRSRGGYIVAPGSVVEAGTYEMEESKR